MSASLKDHFSFLSFLDWPPTNDQMHSSMPTLFNRLGSIAWLTETDREDFSSPSSRSDDANLGKMSSTNLAMRSVTQEIKKLPGGYVEFVVIDWQAAFCRTILFLAGVYICLRRSLSLSIIVLRQHYAACNCQNRETKSSMCLLAEKMWSFSSLHLQVLLFVREKVDFTTLYGSLSKGGSRRHWEEQ